MRKIISVLLCAAMTLCLLSACGNKPSAEEVAALDLMTKVVAGDLSALEERLPQYADALRRQENKRFEAFMRSKGWTQMLPGEVDNVLLRDKLRKRHARLTLEYTEVLEEMTGRNFAEEDLRSIRCLPATIALANALYGKQYSVRTKT